MKLEEALQQLTAGRKSKRLRGLFPAIEQKLAEGITHGEILGLLNTNGLALTECTYKSYLYRYRKRRRTAGQAPVPFYFIEQPKLQIAGEARASTGTSSVDPYPRPRTFDFDPSGIPDLLK